AGRNHCACCESRGSAGQDSPGARDKDPKQQNKCEGKKEMRLDGAEPKRRAGRERASFVEPQKEREPEEQKDGGLAEEHAPESRGKAVPEPNEAFLWASEQLPKDAHGKDEQAQHKQRPRKGCRHGGDKAEWQSQRQSPGSIAHVIGFAARKSRVVLNLIDGRGVVWIAVMD